MKRAGFFIGLMLLVGLVTALAGCGSSKSFVTTIYGRFTTSDDQISDKFYYDLYECTAKEDGNATITMRSDDVEPIIEVDYPGGTVTVRSEYDSDLHEARVTFPVYEGDRYTVWAISNIEAETGDYRLRFSSELTNIEEFEFTSFSSLTKPKSRVPESDTRYHIYPKK